jgi:hypothetical protein
MYVRIRSVGAASVRKAMLPMFGPAVEASQRQRLEQPFQQHV